MNYTKYYIISLLFIILLLILKFKDENFTNYQEEQEEQEEQDNNLPEITGHPAFLECISKKFNTHEEYKQCLLNAQAESLMDPIQY